MGKVQASRVYPEFFRVRPTDRLLDLGCGAGPQLVTFAPSVRRVTGIDVGAERLALARTMADSVGLGNVDLTRADVTRLPFVVGCFNCAIAIDVIEHLDEPGQLLAEARRVLEAHGRLLVTVPALYDQLRSGPLGAAVGRLKGRDGYFGGDLGPDDHRAPRPLSGWEHLFEESGFRVAASGATTLFPPLHRYGVPRFWFSVTALRRAAATLGRVPPLRRLGQAVMYDLRCA